MRKMWCSLSLIMATLISMSCEKSENKEISANPFDIVPESSNTQREKIVVISDLHLGNDLSYSENVKHLNRLVDFLNEIRSSNTVKELVLGGDIFDEWYIPTRMNTYNNGTQADFIMKTVNANKAVFDVLNGIIKDKKVKVTYVPGNHDMGFLPKDIDQALPGVNQARDPEGKYPLGTYYPDNYPQIAIEHGHRYDFFSAMAPDANEADAPGSFLPPGYFFARIAANSFTDPTTPEAATKVPEVKLNDGADPEQVNKNIYYELWKKVMENVIYVKDNFSEPIIRTNVGKFTKVYRIDDIIPHNIADGSIQMNLYNNLFTQANWDFREKYNNVTKMTDIKDAINGSLQTEFIDMQSDVQYFNNQDSDVRIVIFGHTHKPMLKTYTNGKGQPCIYANSGTWEDMKIRDKSIAVDQDALKMDFIIITPVKSDNKKLQVGLYQYKYGQHMLVERQEVKL